ncbi:hypothetical protein [Phocaeicola sp.]
MITDELIRKQYIKQILKRDAAFIYETQAEVIRRNFTNERAKELASFLVKRPYRIVEDGLRPAYYFSIFPYLRFLDIQYSRQLEGPRARLALYNRVVWGRLYHETINDLRYGLTQDMKKEIQAWLEKMNPEKL